MRKGAWLLAGVTVALAGAAGAGFLLLPGGDRETAEAPDRKGRALSEDAQQRLRKLQQRFHDRLKRDAALDGLGQRVRRFVDAHARSAAAHRLLGQLRMEQERREEALRQLERALALDEAQPETALLAGTLAFELEQFKRAARHYRRARKRLPEDPRPSTHLAQTRLRQGRLEEAETLARQALALDRGRHAPHAVLAAIARKRDRPEQAVKHLQEAIRRVPVSETAQRTALTLRQARVLRRSGRPETALQVLRRLYGERGRHFEVLEARAACWAALDKPAKAAEAFERALGSEQADWRSVARAARWRLEAGDREKARAHVRRLARIRPGAEALKRLRRSLEEADRAS
jgi:tetratricopeptide (TPR) repeat protein